MNYHKHQATLSFHQKQIRFFIRLAFVVITLATGLIFWFVNQPGHNV